MAHEGSPVGRADGGSYLAVHVQPGARRNGIGGLHDGALKVSVTAPPERGKANRAVTDLVAARIGIAGSRVRVVAGSTARRKRLFVEGVEPADLASLLGG